MARDSAVVVTKATSGTFGRARAVVLICIQGTRHSNSVLHSETATRLVSTVRCNRADETRRRLPTTSGSRIVWTNVWRRGPGAIGIALVVARRDASKKGSTRIPIVLDKTTRRRAMAELAPAVTESVTQEERDVGIAAKTAKPTNKSYILLHFVCLFLCYFLVHICTKNM